MTTSAGDDQTLRRWRVLLTVGAWLMIAQSGMGLLSGLVSLLLLRGVGAESLLGQMGNLAPGYDLPTVSRLVQSASLLNKVGILANALTLAGSIGLLLRRKWGWYGIVILHLAQTVAALVWGIPVLRSLLALLDPRQAGAMSVLLGILLAAIPASVVVILMLRPIVRQFEKR